jgi:hypothetical protein
MHAKLARAIVGAVHCRPRDLMSRQMYKFWYSRTDAYMWEFPLTDEILKNMLALTTCLEVPYCGTGSETVVLHQQICRLYITIVGSIWLSKLSCLHKVS